VNSVSCHCAALTDGRRSGVPRRGNRGGGEARLVELDERVIAEAGNWFRELHVSKVIRRRAASRRPRCLARIAISISVSRAPAAPHDGARIEDRPGDQPGGPYTAAAAAGAPHAPQHLAHRALRAIEARQFRHGEGSLGGTAGCQAVDRQVESGQLMERTGEDRGPLSAGGGIGGCHGPNI
jgi:hypothetical protein